MTNQKPATTTMQNLYLDLILDNGELVSITCPCKHEDDFIMSVNNAMRRGDVWSCSRFDGCTAEYMGILIDRVNMRRVVGDLG